MSLAELGRFAEAAKYEKEAIKIAEASEYAFTIGGRILPPAYRT